MLIQKSLIDYFENSSSMIILYFVWYFNLDVKENTCTVSSTPENEFMSSRKQSTAPPSHLNIFQSIEKRSFDTEAQATTISIQHPKKRKQTKSTIEATTLPRRQQPKRSRLT